MLCLPKPPALEAVHDIWLKHFRSKLQPGKSRAASAEGSDPRAAHSWKKY